MQVKNDSVLVSEKEFLEFLLWKKNKKNKEQDKETKGDAIVRGDDREHIGKDDREIERTEDNNRNTEISRRIDNKDEDRKTETLELKPFKITETKDDEKGEEYVCAGCGKVFHFKNEDEIPDRCPECDLEWQ